jgi:hypothetical protein
MREWMEQVLGEVSRGEVLLVAAVFVTILAFTWAPRVGATVGSWFDRDP